MTTAKKMSDEQAIAEGFNEFDRLFARRLDHLRSEIGSFLIRYREQLSTTSFQILVERIANHYNLRRKFLECCIQIAEGNIDLEIAKKLPATITVQAAKRGKLPRKDDVVQTISPVTGRFVRKKAKDCTSAELRTIVDPKFNAVPSIPATTRAHASGYFVENQTLVLESKSRGLEIVIPITPGLITDLQQGTKSRRTR